MTATTLDVLQANLQKMDRTTTAATRCADHLANRARQLDALTSPASDASSMLSRANANLAATLVLLKDAREKFDTVADCEPALERLYKGVATLEEGRNRQKGTSGTSGLMSQRVLLTEQDVYAAADSMEILRDAHRYFAQHTSWRSTPNTLAGIERIYKMGEDSMALLEGLHLKGAGPAIRPTRKQSHLVPPSRETAEQVSPSMVEDLSIVAAN
jgi:exocyst complex protein 7